MVLRGITHPSINLSAHYNFYRACFLTHAML